VYLIDELSMRYAVNLFQFILNVIEVMFLEHGIMRVSSLDDCNLVSKNVSNIDEGNRNRQQYVGKAFRSRQIVGNCYPILSIYFHENSMIGIMVLR